MIYQIVDAHCDTVGLIEQASCGYDFCSRNNFGHLDLPRLREGGVKLQFFAFYIREEYAKEGALSYCLRLVDNFYETLSRCNSDLQLIGSAAELEQVMAGPKVGALLSIEGGEALEGELSALRMLFRLGVRALGLTWNHPNQLAVGVGQGVKGEGLSEFGKQVVKEMNRLRMVVDLAHVNEQGFNDAISMSDAPVIVSHANTRALCDHPRNLSDEQLRVLSSNGGVVGLTFYPDFIAPADATLDKLVDHFIHAAEIAGVDHIGLGSDFDGIDKVIGGLEDVTGLPRLVEALCKRGFSAEEVDKITSKNFIRVLKDILPS